MENRLFIYGTLLPGRAPSEIADVVNSLKPIGKGTIMGRLYDFGDYPGVVLDDDANEKVQGDVFVLPSDPLALARLDDYEEYHPQNPEGSLFKRLRTTVTLLNGSRESCWVYVYNRELPKSA